MSKPGVTAALAGISEGFKEGPLFQVLLDLSQMLLTCYLSDLARHLTAPQSRQSGASRQEPGRPTEPVGGWRLGRGLRRSRTPVVGPVPLHLTLSASGFQHQTCFPTESLGKHWLSFALLVVLEKLISRDIVRRTNSAAGRVPG